MADEKTVDQLVGEVKSLVESKHDAVKEIAEKALAEAEKGVPLSEKAKEVADEALTGLNEAKARLDELEQKMVRSRDEQRTALKSAGYQVIENEAVKSFMAEQRSGQRISIPIEHKAIISSLTTDADGSAGDLVVPDRGQLVGGVERRMTVRDLLTPGRTSSGSIQYPKETGFTNAAATHTETGGTAKPQSDIKFAIETATVTTIAHWVRATRQILDDAPMLQSYIDGRLRYGLAYAEEAQLLNGGGTGTDLNGVYTQATASTANLALITSPTKIDVLRVAILQASLAEFPATGIVIHPTDWMGIETTKDTAGNYIVGDPSASAQPRLWGLPVVATQAMTSDKFLVGAFKLGAQIFDRQDARVEISTEDDQNFTKNLVTILAEERLALAVYRPEAFVKGDFSDVIQDLTS
jgi:HK97 family phage major capsid protein